MDINLKEIRRYLSLINIKNNARLFFFFSLLLIGVVFVTISIVTYQQFSSNVIKNEFDSQQQMSKIIDQLLTQYFYTFKFITQNTVIQPEFNPKLTADDKNILYKKISPIATKKIVNSEGIKNILTDKRHSSNLNSKQGNDLLNTYIENWRIFKALPRKDLNENIIANDRRVRAKTILATNPDVHYVFQMLSNGDLIFLEPYNIQKNITIFNYSFRDYLNLVKSTKETSISEGYISNDQYISLFISKKTFYAA